MSKRGGGGQTDRERERKPREKNIVIELKLEQRFTKKCTKSDNESWRLLMQPGAL